VQFPGPHADSLVEHMFEVQWGKWDKQAPTRLGRNGDNPRNHPPCKEQ
jgi:hypothetical protein